MNTFSGFNSATSAVVRTGPGGIHTVTLAAGSDTATLIVYNNTAGSGTVLVELSAVANTTAYAQLDIPCSTGLYAAVTGTAPNATVTFW